MAEMEQKLFDFNVSSYLPNYEAYSGAARDFVAQEEARNARETGASFLDLTTVFAGRPEQMYTDYAHLTPLGNELVAARIRDQILPLLAEHANCASPR
jgi:lysophospholipase L1-like esterase